MTGELTSGLFAALGELVVKLNEVVVSFLDSDEKMAQLPTKRYGAYLRKMAIDGYIIQVDTTDIREMTKALGSIGRNINQIAKRVNAGGPAYQADMEEIRERLEQIWQLQRRILLSQR